MRRRDSPSNPLRSRQPHSRPVAAPTTKPRGHHTPPRFPTQCHPTPKPCHQICAPTCRSGHRPRILTEPPAVTPPHSRPVAAPTEGTHHRVSCPPPGGPPTGRDSPPNPPRSPRSHSRPAATPTPEPRPQNSATTWQIHPPPTPPKPTQPNHPHSQPLSALQPPNTLKPVHQINNTPQPDL